MSGHHGSLRQLPEYKGVVGAGRGRGPLGLLTSKGEPATLKKNKPPFNICYCKTNCKKNCNPQKLIKCNINKP